MDTLSASSVVRRRSLWLLGLATLMGVSLSLGAGCEDDTGVGGSGGEGGAGGQGGEGGEGGSACEWQPPALTWELCEVEGLEPASCATLEVPLDWSDPCGPTTPLALRRREATSPGRIGAMLVHPGGPGISGLWLPDGVRETLGEDVGGRFDIIGWDPRGVAASAGLDCGSDLDMWRGEDITPDSPAEVASLEERYRTFGTACAANAGPLLEHVSTSEMVEDMEAIRRAVGEEKISYFGASYGGFLGAHYANRYPERVRGVVLDSPLNPALSATQHVRAAAEGFELALGRFFEDCSARPECKLLEYGDPAAAFDALMASLEVSGIQNGQHGLLHTEDAEMAFFQGLLYGRDMWGVLEDGIAYALGVVEPPPGIAVGQQLEEAADSFSVGRSFDQWASLWCVDRPLPTLAELAELDVSLGEDYPRVGRGLMFFGRACADWPVAPTQDLGEVTAAGAPPILVLGALGDPVTPHAQSQAVADALETGAFLSADREGHGAFGSSECVNDAVRAYLVDGTLPAANTVCE